MPCVLRCNSMNAEAANTILLISCIWLKCSSSHYHTTLGDAQHVAISPSTDSPCPNFTTAHLSGAVIAIAICLTSWTLDNGAIQLLLRDEMRPRTISWGPLWRSSTGRIGEDEGPWRSALFCRCTGPGVPCRSQSQFEDSASILHGVGPDA
jgi:hypothetical protein